MRLSVMAAPIALALAPHTGADVDGGRRLYRTGTGSPRPTVRITPDAAPLAASALPCAGCHGQHGEGGTENGLAAAALGGSRFLARYDVPALQRALVAGLDAQGRPLSGMPRYRLTDAQVAALRAYLSVIGSESDGVAGVSTTTITIATLLPMTGPDAVIGRAMAAAIARRFDAANARGGIYGRQLRLDTIDLSVGIDAAWTMVRARDDIFAMVASPLPDAPDGLPPLIAPLAPTPADAAGQDARYFLLPSLIDQALAMVDAAATDGAAREMAAIVDPARFDAADRACLRERARRQGKVLTLTMSGSPMRWTGATPLLWLAPAAGLPAALAGTNPVPRRIYLSSLITGRLPDLAKAASLVRIVYSGPDETAPLPEAVAGAGADLLIAGLRGAGRLLDRDTFDRALGVQRASTGSSRGHAANATRVASIDAATGALRPLAPWRAPSGGCSVRDVVQGDES